MPSLMHAVHRAVQGYGASAALNGVITRHASPAATVRLSGPATSVYALEQALLACPSRLLLASILQAARSDFLNACPAWAQYGLEQGRVAAAAAPE